MASKIQKEEFHMNSDSVNIQCLLFAREFAYVFSTIVLYVKISNQVFLLSNSHLNPFISVSIILLELWIIFFRVVGRIDRKNRNCFLKNSEQSYLFLGYDSWFGDFSPLFIWIFENKQSNWSKALTSLSLLPENTLIQSVVWGLFWGKEIN